jgi:hypothetical protein
MRGGEAPSDSTAPVYVIAQGITEFSFYSDHFTRKVSRSPPVTIMYSELERIELSDPSSLGLFSRGIMYLDNKGTSLADGVIVMKIRGDGQELFLPNPESAINKMQLFEWLSATKTGVMPDIKSGPDVSPPEEAQIETLDKTSKKSTRSENSASPMEKGTLDVQAILAKLQEMLGDKYKVETILDGSTFSGFLIKAKSGVFSFKIIAHIEHSTGSISKWNVMCLDEDYIMITDKIRAYLTSPSST